jgi:hypothetical protein
LVFGGIAEIPIKPAAIAPTNKEANPPIAILSICPPGLYILANNVNMSSMAHAAYDIK